MEEKKTYYSTVKGDSSKFFTSKNITTLGVLAAFVIVLQILGSYFVIAGTVRLSFVLVPIVLGALLTGVIGGGILGFIFGLITLIMGIVGADYFTSVLFSEHPVLTILTCIIKGTAAGIIPALAYDFLKNRNSTVATFVASALAPIVNTGLFIMGAFFMTDTLNAHFVAENSNVVYFIFIGCAGVNFLIELAINLVLAPSVCTIIRVIKR